MHPLIPQEVPAQFQAARKLGLLEPRWSSPFVKSPQQVVKEPPGTGKGARPLRQARCTKCGSPSADAAFVPCGHARLCCACAATALGGAAPRCAACAVPPFGFVRVAGAIS